MTSPSNDPIQNLALLRDQIDRLFEVVLTRSDHQGGWENSTQWSPLVDLYETDAEVVLVAEVPGLSMEDLDVQVTDASVILRGTRIPTEEEKMMPQRLERAQGPFSRTFHLSDSIERERVTAEYRLGLLRVVLPKKKSQPRTVKVNKS